MTTRERRWVTRSCAGASFALTLAAALGGAQAANAAANEQLMAAVKACEPDARALLERAVSIDSGTGDVEGLNQLGALFTRELLHAGFTKVEAVPAEAPAVGNNLVATAEGTGRGKILLIAHMDTVFVHGTLEQSARIRLAGFDRRHQLLVGGGVRGSRAAERCRERQGHAGTRA